MLHNETFNRKAFESYNLAKRQVSRYEFSLDVADLDIAIAALDEAIHADENFFKPANYKGIVHDMKGESTEAIKQFDLILSKFPSPSLRDEVQYNKAVAKYHQYGLDSINEAIQILESLDQKLDSNERLSKLVKAALAQSYGMMVHHSSKNNTGEIGFYLNKTEAKANEVIVQLLKSSSKEKPFYNEARWIANNANGIGLMFKDDSSRDNFQTSDLNPFINTLKSAIVFFDEAANSSPHNWAITCNQGSARMRLGHLFIGHDNVQAARYFTEAEKYLDQVIIKLRPNYDFALYEMGRINRFKIALEEKYKKLAISFFDKAIEAGASNPSVSAKTISKEKNAAEKGIILFNPPEIGLQ